jgi:hypothetical protein
MHQSLLAAGGASKLMLIDGDHFIGAHVLSDNSIFDWQRSHCAIAN